MPIRAVRNACHDEEGCHGGDEAKIERGDWVAWLFAAVQRSAPFPQGNLADTASGAPRTAILELIDEQIAYHKNRMRMSEQAGSKLANIGELIFGAVLLSVFLKLLLADWLHLDMWAVACAWAATVLPGVSAAFVGIRAYAELPLLASQSRRMITELKLARRRVLRLNMKHSLVSQDLGAEAATVAALMLQDLEGWVRTFRIKAIEVG